MSYCEKSECLENVDGSKPETLKDYGFYVVEDGYFLDIGCGTYKIRMNCHPRLRWILIYDDETNDFDLSVRKIKLDAKRNLILKLDYADNPYDGYSCGKLAIPQCNVDRVLDFLKKHIGFEL